MTIPRLAGPVFQRSSYCAKDACVEVAVIDDQVLVRDSKNMSPDAPVLRFDAEEWRAFARGMEAGEFSV